MTKAKNSSTRINTGGGAFIGGNLKVRGNFTGRDTTNFAGKEQNIPFDILIEQLNELEAHIEALKLKSKSNRLKTFLKMEIEDIRNIAKSSKPSVDSIKTKLKNIYKSITRIGEDARSIESLLSIISKACKLLGFSLI